MSNGHDHDVAAPTTTRRRDIDPPDVANDIDPVADAQHAIGNRATGQILLAQYSGGPAAKFAPGGAGSGSTTTSTPTRPAKPPWYQEILDRIADEQQNVVTLSTGSTIGGDALPWMNEVKDVALALDAKDVNATRAAVKALLKDQPIALLPYMISEQLDHEMAARAFALGLAPEATNLLRYFRGRNASMMPTAWFSRSYAADRTLWERVTKEATAVGPPKDASAAEKTLNKVLPTLAAVAGEISGLDLARVQSDYSLRHDPSVGLMAGSYDQSISEYWLTLSDLLNRLFILVETCEQMLIDAGTAHLEQGKGAAALEIAKKAHASIGVAIASVGGASIEITRSKWTKPGKHFDFFGGKADTARAIGISFFDPAQTEGEEMKSDYGDIHRARGLQLAFIERLYGLERKGGKPTQEAASNEAAIKAMGGRLQLHSAEDWRRFLLKKLLDWRKDGVSNADALEKMLDLVHAYFTAFTVHTPYNIDEFGDNYLSRSFPRTLAGQLLYDCGVYALRIAYMLSLVRNELHLEFRGVVLPAHVGLVITGDAKAHDMPTYIIHNNRFTKISPKDMSGLRTHWQTHDPSGQPLAKPTAVDEDAVLGELAAGLYASVDSPYRLEKLPNFTAPSTAALQKKYFDWYHTSALPSVLKDEPGPTGEKGVELRYVKFTDELGRYESLGETFWDTTAPAIWKRHKAQIVRAVRAGARAQYLAATKAYSDELHLALDPLIEAQSKITDKRADFGKLLTQHPKVVARGANVFPFDRGMTFSRVDSAIEAVLIHLDVEVADETDINDPDKLDRIEPAFAKPDARKLFHDND